MRAAERLIVALDEAELPAALRMARRLRGLVRTVKVGSVLFTACGPMAVRRLRDLRFSVMLDLKFFDIPHTVELSCRAAGALGVSLLTVHATGGREMLAAAMRGARDGAGSRQRPKVLAVTVLTSVSAEGGSASGGGGGTPAAVRAQVLALAREARAAGCDGVVVSAQEAAAVRRVIGPKRLVVCPGIRPAGSARADQARIATPADALGRGADRLVVGRPITAARDPRAAALAVLREMEACAC